jgi:thiol-disulfide isomerase/thioredoxin
MFRTVILGISLLFASSSYARAIQPFSLPQMNPSHGASVFNTNDYDDVLYVVETYQLRCHYCDDNAPNVGALAAEYADNERVIFIDLGIDSSDRDYAQWISRHNVSHVVLKDASRTVFRQLGARGTPTSYVLDSDLNIVWEHQGVWGSNQINSLRTLIDGWEAGEW